MAWLAIGGDLSAARLLEAYRQGIFPWFAETDPICWWSTAPRTVLLPESLYVCMPVALYKNIVQQALCGQNKHSL